ncbi:MAG: heat-inducible transcription repressor HrcA [Firmicutes bacterium]|nr:heat-inducible transcription repressor HrcA [Bacillota bacterium]
MNERKQRILLAIVQDYVATAEPVGSRTIARKYGLGISPATIRNEVADLEELGYVEQPHTSAGRIPSERGYRYYVDHLMRRETLSPEEEEVITRGYALAGREITSLLQQTGRLLARLTRYTAFVMAPVAGRSVVQHVQVVPMGPARAVVVVVLVTGKVLHRFWELPEEAEPAAVEQVARAVNARARGLVLNEAVRRLREAGAPPGVNRGLFIDLVGVLADMGTGEHEDGVITEGLFNILEQPEFRDVERVKVLFGTLEKGEVIRDLLASHQEEGVTVRIGGEIRYPAMRECSVVVGSYRMRGRVAGSLAVLGPTRMVYARVVTVMDRVAQQLSATLDRLYAGR